MARRLSVFAAAVLLGAAAASIHGEADGATRCKVPLHTVSGWEAVFGVRSSRSAAETLRIRATRVGFQNLVVERVGCTKWAVALHGLKNRRQGRALAAEAKPAGFTVTLACYPVLDLDGDWQAVFGTFKTRSAAESLRTRATRVGFQSLLILRNLCTGRYYVELDGLKSLRQAHEFQREAKQAGFTVTIKHH